MYLQDLCVRYFNTWFFSKFFLHFLSYVQNIFFYHPWLRRLVFFKDCHFFLSPFLALAVPTWQSFMLYILCTVWYLLCWSIACCTYFHLFSFPFSIFFACSICFSRAWQFLNLAVLLSCVRQEIKKEKWTCMPTQPMLHYISYYFNQFSHI